MADVKTDCALHLTDSITTEQEAVAFSKKLQKIAGQTDKDISVMKEQVERTLREELDNSLKQRQRRVRDNILTEVNYRKALVTYEVDPKTGEQKRVVLDKLSDINKNRLNQLVGRGGLDTQHRTMRRHLEKYHEQTENVLSIDSTSKIRRRSDIAKGSPEEREFFKAVRQVELMNPDEMTGEKLASLTRGKSAVQQLAVVHKLSNEYARKTVNRYGADIKYSEGYVVGRVYEWGQIEKMGREGFTDFLMEKLDLRKTFGDQIDEATARRKLRETWTSMKGDASIKVDEISQFVGGGTRGDSQARAFVFKDLDSEYDALNQFSARSLNELALSDARSAASTAVKIRNFGYDSKRVLEQVNSQLVREFGSGKVGLVDSFTIARINQAQLELTGQQSHVQTSLTTWANSARLVNAFTMLGNALSTTALDLVENNRQAFFVNGHMFGGVAEYAATMRKLITPQMIGGWSKEEIKHLADAVGVVFSYQSNAEGMRMASGELMTTGNRPHDWLSRRATKIMNWTTLLPAQTGYSNIASRVTALNEFNILIGDARSGNLTTWQKDFLQQSGITNGELNALKSGKIKGISTIAGTDLVTGKAVRDSLLSMQPAKAAELLGVAPEQAADAIMGLAEKVDMIVDDFGVRATPQPELATKTLIGKASGNERIRVASGIFLQFMDTPIAQTQNFVELVEKARRVKGSNLGAAAAIAPHLAIYTGMAIPTLLAADAVMSILLNKESIYERYMNAESEQDRSFILGNVLNKTMFVPFAAEMLENQFAGGYNSDVTDTFSSPTFKRAKDTFALLNPSNRQMTVERYGRRYTPNSIPIQFIRNWGGAAVDKIREE